MTDQFDDDDGGGGLPGKLPLLLTLADFAVSFYDCSAGGELLIQWAVVVSGGQWCASTRRQLEA